ncbi:hybrid sensor histidine kinase/response regulator [Limimaricola hongkongensis]|uniref:histidine kinase n=1 Tax=Limimaricola hongkongensis DSM 17492 TaxID=1122180 RepID=A0A017H9U5_9RHOB|nr:ATP-binding protein [Limimaricola hongkongensis]EYD70933.1 sensory box histidine kinase/response regulator [Limimaricola hongkongensis DSM 17492]
MSIEPPFPTRRRRRFNVRTGLGIAAAIVLTMVLSLGWMLGRQIRELESAGVDNTKWTLAQLELETAIFARDVIAIADGGAVDNIGGLQLRFDILMSRLGLVRHGEIGRSLLEYPQVPRLLDQIDSYAARIDSLFMGPVGHDMLVEIYEETRAVQPVMRELSLNGLDILAADAEAYRHQVRRQAELTALAGGLLLVLLGALLRLIDVQRRRVMERDRVLSRTAERLNSVIGSSLDAIVVTDRDGSITDFNPAAEAIFGWNKDEILHRPVYETIVPEARREGFKARLGRFHDTGMGQLVGAGRMELAAQRRTGEVFPIEAVITSVEGPRGPVFIGYLRDITDLKAAQARLIDARDAAERADRAKSRFLSVMSHEMRTPLNGIMGVLDLLSTSPMTSEQRRQVGIALASAEILLQLVNESLDITRIETGEETIEAVPFTPVPMLERLMSVLRPLAAEKDLPLELETDEADHGIWYEGDPNRVAQIVTNLIGNAVKFTEHGGITVILRLEAAAIEIAVRDTGIGIAPEDVENVFAEFVTRARPEGRQGRSDGLGLAISRRLARMMSGDITVCSTPGRGSTFRLRLPLQRVAPPVDAPEPEILTAAAPGTGLSVLVVEDNAVNRMVLRGMLQQLGHEVSEEQNGAKGLARLRDETFDLVLMDFEMPVMGGIDAMRIFRDSAPAQARPPVIGLTAHGSAEARTAGLRAGMSEVYAKPLRLPVLRRILDDMAAAPAASAVLPDTAPETDPDPDPETGPDTASEEGAAIDVDDFDDMLGMLGAERLTRALDGFEAEWHEAVPGLTGQVDTAGGVAALAHKLRGGAAMLGLTGPVITLGEMETRAPERYGTDEIAALGRQVAAALSTARARIETQAGAEAEA